MGITGTWEGYIKSFVWLYNGYDHANYDGFWINPDVWFHNTTDPTWHFYPLSGSQYIVTNNSYCLGNYNRIVVYGWVNPYVNGGKGTISFYGGTTPEWILNSCTMNSSDGSVYFVMDISIYHFTSQFTIQSLNVDISSIYFES